MIATYKDQTATHPDSDTFFECFVKAVPVGHQNFRMEKGVVQMRVESEFLALSALLESRKNTPAKGCKS